MEWLPDEHGALYTNEEYPISTDAFLGDPAAVRMLASFLAEQIAQETVETKCNALRA